MQHISINDVINLAIREEDPDKGITHMLAKIGQILAAERIILMEEEEDGFHLRCSYDWHKDDDTLGHEQGDLLIQTIAFVLTEIIGQDKVFRLGGDEFLSITPCENAIGAGNLLRRIEKHLKAHAASAALGYVIHQAPFGDIDDIIHEADANMYRDKQKKHRTREDLL
ncbi:diguanylate cyclase domain-containing protein [uncultured Mitsuokella sp.]|uniref:diguanylate cyclase domain-containing protein n=1 Tax=uncultured Mitsuokella sp. TaxID=453120 RepID=UPI0025F7001E|nr:diguanylate cyclase [uncultured Mitsuokella sp.]